MQKPAQFVSFCSDSCYAQQQFESQSARKLPNEMMPIFSPIYFLYKYFSSETFSLEVAPSSKSS